jgi:hypothetical protein
MKFTIAASIRLLFILTLVAIFVSAETPLIEVRAGLASAGTAFSRGKEQMKEFCTQSGERAKCRSGLKDLSALGSLRKISGRTAK